MKNLEIEYKQQIANEVPDLWSRIEAGITAVDNERKNNNNVISLETAKPKKKVNILKYSAIIGAAACALVVVVAMINSSDKMSAAEAPAATSDYSYADTADTCEATCEEAAPAAYEAAAQEAPSENKGKQMYATAPENEAVYADTDDVCGEEACEEETDKSYIAGDTANSANPAYAGYDVFGKLVSVETSDKYLIIEVKCDDTSMYIFVPEDKMDEVSNLNINDEYEFTVYEYTDNKPQDIIDNDDVMYEYLGVYLDE